MLQRNNVKYVNFQHHHGIIKLRFAKNVQMIYLIGQKNDKNAHFVFYLTQHSIIKLKNVSHARYKNHILI
jgi:hypothetical protein